MKFKLCNPDTRLCGLVSLPMRGPDGSFEIRVCRACAKINACPAHNQPRISFQDEVAICLTCVEERINTFDIDEGNKILKLLNANLSKEVLWELSGWGVKMARLFEDNTQRCFLRIIVAYALRNAINEGEVTQRVVREHSIDFLLPPIL